MLTLVKFDLINRLKKPITWFLVIIICILIGFNLLQVQEERVTRPFIGHNVMGFQDSSFRWSEEFVNDKQKVAYPNVYKSLKLIDELSINAVKGAFKKDYHEINRIHSLYNLIFLKKNRLTMDPVSDIMLKDDIYEMWVDVSNGIPYDSVDFRPIFFSSNLDINYHLLGGKYYHNLYVNNFEPIYSDEVNNLTAIYNYLFKIIPLIIFLVIILFTYNNVNRDKNDGTLKLLLTQSIDRGTYYIGKWVGSILYILTILFIPPILMSILAGFIGSFKSFRYPVFYLNNAFARLIPIPNYFDNVKRDHRIPQLHARVFGHIAPEYQGYTSLINPNKDIDIIPFYKYLLMVIILLILFIMFAVAFAQLISTIINNEIIGLITSSLLVGIFIYIGWPFTQERAYNLNPFTFFNVSRIVEGTYNVTFLTSALIMIISTILLLIFGRRHFNKKEI